MELSVLSTSMMMHQVIRSVYSASQYPNQRRGRLVEQTFLIKSANTILFLVAEGDKKRWRIITWPISMNMHMETSYFTKDEFTLEDVLDICKWMGTQAGKSGFTVDLKCSFYQVLLPEQIRDAFVFRVGKRFFRFRRLPMGLATAPEIMQLISTVLAEEAKAKSGGQGLRVSYKVHVDNIVFVGEENDCLEVQKNLIEIAKEWKITFSENTTVSSSVTFVGMVFDLGKPDSRYSSVTASIKKIEKIAKLTLPMHTDVQHCISTISKLLYYSRILWHSDVLFPQASDSGNVRSLAFYYVSITFFRQLARVIGSDMSSLKNQLTITPQIMNDFHRWKATLLGSPAAQLNLSSFKLFKSEVWTDASLEATGVVVRTTSGEEHFYKEVFEIEHINCLELRTLGDYIKEFCWVQRNMTINAIDWFTDSQVAFYAMEKKYSGSYQINECLKFIQFQLARSRGIIHRQSWVPTETMLADYLTRSSTRNITTTGHGMGWKVARIARKAIGAMPVPSIISNLLPVARFL